MVVNSYLRAASNAVIVAFARCLQFTDSAYDKWIADLKKAVLAGDEQGF